jgi:Ca2+-binding RTX toxin-like protein
MKTYTRQMLVLFLAAMASLFLLEAYAAKPVKITVTAAFPDSALQGDTAEVEIDGTGFDAGSTARFIVTDTRDDTQIVVNEVTFDTASGKLKAKIKVKDAALPVEYDIEVMTSSGRRGKGTTMFRVREKAGVDEPIQLGPENDVWPGPGDDNSGEDEVYGGDGNDIISGGLGKDFLYGESGEDILDGADGNDRLIGGPGYDLLYGGPGDDIIYLPVFGETTMDFADGGDGFDSLLLRELEYVDLDVRTGEYTGYYFVVDKKTSTKITVSGEFSNIESFMCAIRGGTYQGDEFDNTFMGYGGEHVMYGHGGNDQLTGGFADSSSDYLDGGDGDDQLQGVYGDDYLIGGSGKDTVYIRKGLGHDVMEDFIRGEDIISIFNSDVCFQDLHMSLVDFDDDGIEDDTYITWRVKRKLNTVSITLLDIEPEELSETDFDFTWDPLSEYSSDCP